MSKHNVNWPVDYDGKRYEKDGTITFKDDDVSQAQAADLIAAGAIGEAIKAEQKPAK